MTKKRTATIQLTDLKDPDGWGEVIQKLRLSEAKQERYFQWSEYASIELQIDSDMNIIGGRILPVEG